MTNLTNLWLWGNQLTGGIPDLSGLTSLDKLKLANNDLMATSMRCTCHRT